MNEREKAEFERHKLKAEQQLSQMYYGANRKSPQKDGASKPQPFMPQKQQGGKNTQGGSFEKSSAVKTEPTCEKPKAPPSFPIKRENILSFLNFKGMKMDNDRLIILAICLLLAGEETDELLMLALIYIMI